MISRIIIRGTSETSAVMYVETDGPTSPDDLPLARKLLLEGVLSVEKQGTHEYSVPWVKLDLLRGFLANIGAADQGSARRLLLMALLQLEDEDDERRFVMPHPVLPIIAAKE